MVQRWTSSFVGGGGMLCAIEITSSHIIAGERVMGLRRFMKGIADAHACLPGISQSGRRFADSVGRPGLAGVLLETSDLSAARGVVVAIAGECRALERKS